MWLQIPERPELAGKPRRRVARALVLSTALVVIALIVVQVVAVPWWTAAPDTVRVTVEHHAGNGSAPDVVTTIYDRTSHDPALARRLQRDLEALPTFSSNAPTSCPRYYNYDTYTLNWSRSGYFVEWASINTPGCPMWDDVTLIYHETHRPPTSDTIYVDLHTLLGAPLPLCVVASDHDCRLPAEIG